jgi:hypothetical protein
MNVTAMKTIANWFLLAVFALQATGAVWFAHLGQCCQDQGSVCQKACCQCSLCRDAGAARHVAGPFGHVAGTLHRGADIWAPFYAFASKHNGDGYRFQIEAKLRSVWTTKSQPVPLPIPHRHDSRTCGICQLLLTLAATPQVPPALPAANLVAFDRPALSDQPAAHTFLSTLDARGPPACTL